MKKFYCFQSLLILFSVFFFSCASTELRVPGETELIFKNISTEYYNIAEGYMDIKKYDKAAEYYKLAMRNKELNLPAYYKLARSYALAKNWEKASQCYDELLKLDPENSMLKVSIAYITAMSGKTDEGILQYKELLKANPYDQNLLESYVALLISVGRGEDAEESFFVLKEKFPDNKQLSTFAQQLDELVDNFNADKKAVQPQS
ncbi:tetratricopeptide repeat protein [Treponema ruminis]|uniref:Tetratricopeptide (TPR) repeat protein n=1 Tax=Treponema ruminis TaxID=744515 RepID=A0A7W8G8Q7_9SPIR|nr:tetratricopeptide repeat protein [Treponema ruminis]MBB5225771.1 tetratricopeptide (TPR) repeat protein [Treponema ruminis]QSI02461.1 tetratricopeptide repeat protein [Treponema ruminis]